MNVFSAADADEIRRFKQVQTAADPVSAHIHVSLTEICRNLRWPSQPPSMLQKLSFCGGVTAKQQPHRNIIKVGEQKQAKRHILQNSFHLR